MKKYVLTAVVNTARDETRNALQTVYDALNQGQRKKILKDESVKRLLDLYGVKYEEEITWE